MKSLETIQSFLLVDSALIPSAALASVDSSVRPRWLIPIYDEIAASVSPLVIDMHAAQECGELAVMMLLLNAAHPQLHVSIIDTSLSHAALIQHLRRFIMVKTHDGQAFTLRFADCLGLPVLAGVFNVEQWTALAGPIKRWCVHGRTGALSDLPMPDRQLTPASTPLILTAQQLVALAEATAPDEMIANIREMRHDRPIAGSMLEQHQWAVEARSLWRSVGSNDLLVLRWLTAAALDTRGGVLKQPCLIPILMLQDEAAIRAGLDDVVAQASEQLACDAHLK
jgi:hypothetical protein